MIYVQYDEAVREMAKGLNRFMGEEDAKHFAEIFAGNSLDGIYSHGMNRRPRRSAASARWRSMTRISASAR